MSKTKVNRKHVSAAVALLAGVIAGFIVVRFKNRNGEIEGKRD